MSTTWRQGRRRGNRRDERVRRLDWQITEAGWQKDRASLNLTGRLEETLHSSILSDGFLREKTRRCWSRRGELGRGNCCHRSQNMATIGLYILRLPQAKRGGDSKAGPSFVGCDCCWNLYEQILSCSLDKGKPGWQTGIFTESVSMPECVRSLPEIP